MEFFAEISGAAQALFSVTKESMPDARQLFVELERQNEMLLDEISSLESQIVQNQHTQPDALRGLAWFENMTDYITLIGKVEELIAYTLIDNLDAVVSHARSHFLLALTFAILVGVLSPAVTALYGYRARKMNNKMKAFAEKLPRKREELKAEVERAELLLYQMIPKQIAEELKQGHEVLPEHYRSVTVYFSDIFGFVELASKSTPFQVMQVSQSDPVKSKRMLLCNQHPGESNDLTLK